MSGKYLLLGGPHSGKQMPDVGHVLKMPKLIPLSTVLHGEGSDQIVTQCETDRYVATSVRGADRTFMVYVYEYDLHKNLVGMMISELMRIGEKS
jgi:hypothetical protein